MAEETTLLVDLKTGQFSPANISGRTYAWASSENVGGTPMLFGGETGRTEARFLDKGDGKYLPFSQLCQE